MGRQELIKKYLAALAADGEFEGCDSPKDLLIRAGRAFATDIARAIGSEGMKRVSATVGAKFQRFVEGLSGQKVGDILGAVWKQAQDAYARGVDENTRGR